MLNRRHVILGLVFVLTLAASVLDLPWLAAQEPAASARQRGASAERPAAAAAAAQGPGAVPIGPAASPVSAPRMRQAASNPFSAHSWLPPIALAKAQAPAAPSAPSLPFTYLGKMQDGATVTVFVSQGGRNHVLHDGDTLAGYRVESITATEMTFVYLSLNEKQRLTFGSEN